MFSSNKKRKRNGCYVLVNQWSYRQAWKQATWTQHKGAPACLQLGYGLTSFIVSLKFHSFSPSLPVVSEGPAILVLKSSKNRPGNQLMITDCHAIHRHCCRQRERQKEREGRKEKWAGGLQDRPTRTAQTLPTQHWTLSQLRLVAVLRLVLEKCSYACLFHYHGLWSPTQFRSCSGCRRRLGRSGLLTSLWSCWCPVAACPRFLVALEVWSFCGEDPSSSFESLQSPSE